MSICSLLNLVIKRLLLTIVIATLYINKKNNYKVLCCGLSGYEGITFYDVDPSHGSKAGRLGVTDNLRDLNTTPFKDNTSFPFNVI